MSFQLSFPQPLDFSFETVDYLHWLILRLQLRYEHKMVFRIDLRDLLRLSFQEIFPVFPQDKKIYFQHLLKTFKKLISNCIKPKKRLF